MDAHYFGINISLVSVDPCIVFTDIIWGRVGWECVRVCVCVCVCGGGGGGGGELYWHLYQ